MSNKKRAGKKLIFFIIFTLSLSISVPLGAQTIIALHPFRGPSETDQIASQFFLRMIQGVRTAEGGNYLPFIIDLNQRPPDVPEGGFPPWICPSPSMTGNASHAITGEAAIDPDDPDSFRMRAYLWQMEGARLLGSDEMSVRGVEDLDAVPMFVEMVLSWIDTSLLPQIAPPVWTAPPAPVQVQGPTFQENWLYLGLRGGGGYSRWAYDFGNDNPMDQYITNFFDVNLSFHAAVSIVRFFRIQGELNVFSNFGPVRNLSTGESDGTYLSLSLQTPLLLKFVWHGETIRTSAFGGVYMHLPLMQRGSDTALEFYNYRADIPGFTAGMNIGWHLGPGTLFLDLRMAYDGRWYHRDDRGELHYTNTVRLNLGYELGFFPKRPRN